jgi:hypothetical protein
MAINRFGAYLSVWYKPPRFDPVREEGFTATARGARSKRRFCFEARIPLALPSPITGLSPVAVLHIPLCFALVALVAVRS